MSVRAIFHFFFFNATATTEIYTLSLHDALPISALVRAGSQGDGWVSYVVQPERYARSLEKIREAAHAAGDRKSTRLNSSHRCISYAVFCLKKKKKHHNNNLTYSNTLELDHYPDL